MRSRISFVVCVSLALTAAAPVAAPAGMPRDRGAIRATVNICDTGKHPNTIGIRARTASTSSRDVLYMRFRAQWLSGSDKLWHNLKSGGDSGWQRVGRGAYERLESGYSFAFAPPATLRGKVYYRWRQRGRTVDETTRYTKSGFEQAAASDPPGYSAGSCEIEAP